MVISRSGKRPHLILPKKKSGGLSCDDDCPQYKSAKLCSHTVAAAEYNHQLDQFISSYGNIKKVPTSQNLLQLAYRKEGGVKEAKLRQSDDHLFLLKQELSLTLSRATALFGTTRDLIEWARALFGTISIWPDFIESLITKPLA